MSKRTLMGLGLAAFILPVWGANPGHPGAINYVEGQVSLDGQSLSSKAIGSAGLETGQVLETQNGKAELLLTPGVLLRLGSDSAVRTDHPGLTHTQVAMLRGEASHRSHAALQEQKRTTFKSPAYNGAMVSLVKKGLYDIDATTPQVEVYKGEMQVHEGDSQVNVKEGKQLPLAPGQLKVQKFDKHNQDALYAWSNLRSEYPPKLWPSPLAPTSSTVRAGMEPAGIGNPWFGTYAFIPGDGFLYSPFGYGFYSPGYAVYAPVYRGWSGTLAAGLYNLAVPWSGPRPLVSAPLRWPPALPALPPLRASAASPSREPDAAANPPQPRNKSPRLPLGSRGLFRAYRRITTRAEVGFTSIRSTR